VVEDARRNPARAARAFRAWHRGDEGIDAVVASLLLAETFQMIRALILGLAKGGKGKG
jgi:hypothetical protein